MISCVDMNPCQGHLLELKLASIRALEYEDHWKVCADYGLQRSVTAYTGSAAAFWRRQT